MLIKIDTDSKTSITSPVLNISIPNESYNLICIHNKNGLFNSLSTKELNREVNITGSSVSCGVTDCLSCYKIVYTT